MSEGLTLTRIMDGIIRASMRERGCEPSNFLIGDRDVAWLKAEQRDNIWIDLGPPVSMEYCGIPISQLEGATGIIGVDGITFLRLVATGQVKPIQ